jgi:hypothetical protein
MRVMYADWDKFHVYFLCWYIIYIKHKENKEIKRRWMWCRLRQVSPVFINTLRNVWFLSSVRETAAIRNVDPPPLTPHMWTSRSAPGPWTLSSMSGSCQYLASLLLFINTVSYNLLLALPKGKNGGTSESIVTSVRKTKLRKKRIAVTRTFQRMFPLTTFTHSTQG